VSRSTARSTLRLTTSTLRDQGASVSGRRPTVSPCSMTLLTVRLGSESLSSRIPRPIRSAVCRRRQRADNLHLRDARGRTLSADEFVLNQSIAFALARSAWRPVGAVRGRTVRHQHTARAEVRVRRGAFTTAALLYAGAAVAGALLRRRVEREATGECPVTSGACWRWPPQVRSSAP
jgi:hypothetical protein